jgi:CheY-like chemotaxis protein
VSLAASGAQALAILAATPDVTALLVDMTMPEMDGSELATRARQLRPDLRIIMCSGYDARAALPRVANLGVEAFLQKPFSSAELERALMG